VELVIVGDGPERSSIEGLVGRLSLTGRVTIQGYAAHDDLPELYRSFDAVVVPSLETSGWIEQFGRVAVEAMASGCAVVASDSGSLPEVIGTAGVLVPPGDETALVGALKAFRDDPAERQRLGTAGVARAAFFSWPAVAARHASLYAEMAG